MEDKIPYEEMFAHAAAYQAEVDKKLDAKMPKFSRNYWWNTGGHDEGNDAPDAHGLRRIALGEWRRSRAWSASAWISPARSRSASSTRSIRSAKSAGCRMGIAEQSATAAAVGLAKEGKLPVFGTYATFAAARNLDQIRVSICYGNFNVMIAGAHGGVSVGPDGATHQALEDLFAMCGTAQYVRRGSLRLGGNEEGDDLPVCSNTRARSTSASHAKLLQS